MVNKVNIGKVSKYVSALGAETLVEYMTLPYAYSCKNPLYKIPMFIASTMIASMVGEAVGAYTEVKVNKLLTEMGVN